MNHSITVKTGAIAATNGTAGVPEIQQALRAYANAPTRRDALKALGVLALLRSVYQQGVRDGRKEVAG